MSTVLVTWSHSYHVIHFLFPPLIFLFALIYGFPRPSWILNFWQNISRILCNTSFLTNLNTLNSVEWLFFTFQCHLKVQNNMATINQKIYWNCKKCFYSIIYLLCPWNDLYMTLSWPWRRTTIKGNPEPCHLYYPGVGASVVLWLKAHVLQNSNWPHFALLLALVQSVIEEGSGDIRVGYYPSKPHIVTVPPRMRVGRLSSHNMLIAALWNTPLQQKRIWKR